MSERYEWHKPESNSCALFRCSDSRILVEIEPSNGGYGFVVKAHGSPAEVYLTKQSAMQAAERHINWHRDRTEA